MRRESQNECFAEPATLIRFMKYEEAMRILLEGTCGVNEAKVTRECGASRPALRAFISGAEITDNQLDRIGMFIWRKMNAHLLLSEDDFSPIPNRERATTERVASA